MTTVIKAFDGTSMSAGTTAINALGKAGTAEFFSWQCNNVVYVAKYNS